MLMRAALKRWFATDAAVGSMTKACYVACGRRAPPGARKNEVVMYRGELQKLEGVWTGTERIDGDGASREANGRWEFHTVFDGRFLLCDYIQTAVDRATAVAHGVFRKDDVTNALTVSWFRSPGATTGQQTDGVAEGDKLVFVETIADDSTRTTYSVALNRLSVITERSVRGGEWKSIFEGSYRRPRG
jgi:hypothetical protein